VASAHELIEGKPSADLANHILSIFRHDGRTDYAYLLYHIERFRDTFYEFSSTWSAEGRLPHETRVLDIGCHWLHHSMFYAKAGFHVTAADMRWVVEHDAHKSLAPAHGITLFGYDDLASEGLSGLPDDSIDVVLFCEILEHLTFNPVDFWKHVYRVLRPGGRIVLTTPNYYCLDGRAFDLGRTLRRMGGGIRVDDLLLVHNSGPHWKEFSVKEVQRYFRILSPDFGVSKVSYRHEHYPISRVSMRDKLSALLQQRIRPLRQNIHMEIDLKEKRTGITAAPAWHHPDIASYS
jgi:2-polyprenyl-3-methyl-5-hydroxy-6-metoxy-1,4-benzoquinol methylase